MATYLATFGDSDDEGRSSVSTNALVILGGAEGTRTPDPHTASVVRYQLRHGPQPVPVSRAPGNSTHSPGGGHLRGACLPADVVRLDQLVPVCD